MTPDEWIYKYLTGYSLQPIRIPLYVVRSVLEKGDLLDDEIRRLRGIYWIGVFAVDIEGEVTFGFYNDPAFGTSTDKTTTTLYGNIQNDVEGYTNDVNGGTDIQEIWWQGYLVQHGQGIKQGMKKIEMEKRTPGYPPPNHHEILYPYYVAGW